MSDAVHLLVPFATCSAAGCAEILRGLQLPNLQAIQWAQGPGKDWPILQWAPLIRRIQAAGKSMVIDLEPSELEAFISELRPEGLLLVLNTNGEDEEQAIIRRVEKW